MTKGKTTMHILDVAKWNATDNEILACKFVTASHEDRFTTKSRLIVSTGQEAVVVLNGNMTGPFKPCPEGHAMVRQAKLGRTNRMKGVCTAKKTTCR